MTTKMLTIFHSRSHLFKALAERYRIVLKTLVFLPHPANVLSFCNQENINYKTFFSTLISKSNQKHFTTNLLDAQCFIVYPSSKHVEDTFLGPFDRQCVPSPTLNETFKMAMDEGICSGEVSKKG